VSPPVAPPSEHVPTISPVGNRHNAVEHNELQGDRYVMTGVDKVEPNAWVAVEVEAERFMSFFIDRLAGK